MIKHFFVLAASGLAIGVAAQSVPAIAIKPANASLPEEFTLLGSVRELPDGRVLITDERENRVVVTDLAFGKVTQVGRKGEGPGEYLQVSRLWSIGGDSTIMAERFASKWHLFVGSRIVATIPSTSPGIAVIGTTPLSGTDTHGNVIASVGRMVNRQMPDSNALVRFNRGSNRTDTVARLSAKFGEAELGGVAAAGAPPANVKPRYTMGIIARDVAVEFPDGWIAIARVSPYRVDWCPPASACVHGPLLPGQPSVPSERDRQTFLEYSVKTTGWPKTTVLDETSQWPSKLPSFAMPGMREDGSPLTVTPEGRVLVERLPSAAQPLRRYDVIDRRGNLAAMITLPIDQRIAGFGVKSVYITTTDADGVQRVSRHAWP